MTSCNLSRKKGTDPETWAEASALIARANEAAGAALISDQAMLETQTQSRELFFVNEALAPANAQPVGLVLLAADEFDLVIDPAFEQNGFGGCALEQVLNVTSGNLRVWVHGEQPAANKLLTENLFRVQRTLLMMGVPRTDVLAKLGEREQKQDVLGNGFSITSFTKDDAEDWVALNAKVFAEHPEQGSLTLDDLHAREREPWFNPEHFQLLRNSTGELIGYCWMKVIGAEAELYVIGIDPAHSGKSLGSALLDHTLREILDNSGGSAASPKARIEHVTLYVDEANVSAVALYAALGFSTWRTSRQWMLNRR